MPLIYFERLIVPHLCWPNPTALHTCLPFCFFFHACLSSFTRSSSSRSRPYPPLNLPTSPQRYTTSRRHTISRFATFSSSCSFPHSLLLASNPRVFGYRRWLLLPLRTHVTFPSPPLPSPDPNHQPPTGKHTPLSGGPTVPGEARVDSLAGPAMVAPLVRWRWDWAQSLRSSLVGGFGVAG